MLMVVVMVIAAFLAGYGLNAGASSRAVNAYEWCFVHGVVENGRVYCDMTGFGQDACGRRMMKMSAPFANSVVSVGLLWGGRSDEVGLESVVFVEGDGGIGAPALAPGGGSGVVRGERRFRRRAIGSGVWTSVSDPQWAAGAGSTLCTRAGRAAVHNQPRDCEPVFQRR